MGDVWFTIEKVSFLHAHLFSCGAPVRDVCLQPLADLVFLQSCLHMSESLLGLGIYHAYTSQHADVGCWVYCKECLITTCTFAQCGGD